MDSTKASIILFILLLTSVTVIFLYQSFAKRFLYGDAVQRPPKADVASGPKFIRISGVPQDWTEDGLNGLLAVEPTCMLQNKKSDVTLYPACYGTRRMGHLTLGKRTEFFKSIDHEEITLEIAKQDSTATVGIDGHFHDLTPLNTPENCILADVVTVFGLGGHAFGTRRSGKTGKMWLKDFLPHDVKRIRILSYAYNSQLIENRADEDILDYRRHFLQMLGNARESAEEMIRPIIFIAHDIGGLSILQALLQSKQGHQTSNLFESLLQMVEDVAQGDPSIQKSFIKQLDDSSNLLSTQRDDITQYVGLLNLATPECLKSLKRFDCKTYKYDQFSKRHGTSCSWLFINEHYRPWLEYEDRQIFWARGGPGFGKTVLSSVLTEAILSKTKISFGADYLVAYFSVDKDKHLRKSNAALSSQLAQLLSQDPNALVHFTEEEDCQAGREKMEWDLGKTSQPHVRVDLNIPDVIKLSLETNNAKNVSDYVNISAEKLEQRKFPIGIRKDTKKALIEGSSGMFLWVYLILYELKTSSDSSESNIRTKLKSPPKSIPDMYNRILGDIKVDDVEASNNILRWVLWAKRPLSLQELEIAIARPKHRSTSEISKMMRFDLEGDIHSIIRPPMNIRKGLVNLVHQSAKEYLKYTGPIKSEAISAWTSEPNPNISISCLAYLSFDIFDQGPVYHDSCLTKNHRGEIRERCAKNPFLLYCASHWPHHVRQLDNELQGTPLLRNFVLKLATSKHKFNLRLRIYTHDYRRSWEHRMLHGYRDPFQIRIDFWFSSLLQALLGNRVSDGGLEKISRYLVENWADINAQGCGYGILLQNASARGLEETVRVLIEYGADVNSQGGKYGNALQAAGATRHAKIVRYLVENGANINTQGGKYGNALQAAAATRHVEIVRYLVENGADVNAQRGKFGNPLQAAAAARHAEIVRYLVENGADVNAQGGKYGNPLQAASISGCEKIVHYLIENGVDLNAHGGEYGNALSAAEFKGHNRIIHFLLEKGATRNPKDPDLFYLNTI